VTAYSIYASRAICYHPSVCLCLSDGRIIEKGVLQRQSHRRSGLATLPSVGAVP